MRNEFTAVVEQDADWWVAYSPEIPGANGQGRSKDEALASLKEAIALILYHGAEITGTRESAGSRNTSDSMALRWDGRGTC